MASSSSRPIRAVCTDGVFSMPWLEGKSIQKGFGDVMKWKWSAKPPKFPTPEEAARLAPSTPVDRVGLTRPVPAGQLRATWCGHASFLVQMDNGCNVLTDPVWSQRASPLQCAGPARYVDVPIKLEELPVKVHVVTISHNHYDHLDTATVISLHRLFQPIFVVPLGMKQWFSGLSDGEKNMDRVVELGWYDSMQLEPAASGVDGFVPRAAPPHQFVSQASSGTLPPGHVRITGVPVQHWTLRSGFDRNKQLWCGFVIESESGVASDARVIRWNHLGDTGYHAAPFVNIGAQFPGGFDLSLIPIGAYEPRWFMCEQHIDPEQAVVVHRDIGSRFSLGMHWGTFILTDEPLDAPPQELIVALDKYGMDRGCFLALKHGETVAVPMGRERASTT